MKTFFTSDTHFRHINVPKFDKSPFWSEKAQEINAELTSNRNRGRLSSEKFDSLIRQEKEELQKCIVKQDEAIINNWNSVISDGDDVYHLGDVTFSKDETTILNILDRLNGNIYLISGNHDQPVFNNKRVYNKFRWVKPYHEAYFGKIKVCMFHYPIHEWNGAHRGAWMLHGHTHIHDDYDSSFKRCNVGIMNWNYTPVSMDQLEIFMCDKDIKSHH